MSLQQIPLFAEASLTCQLTKFAHKLILNKQRNTKKVKKHDGEILLLGENINILLIYFPDNLTWIESFILCSVMFHFFKPQ